MVALEWSSLCRHTDNMDMIILIVYMYTCITCIERDIDTCTCIQKISKLRILLMASVCTVPKSCVWCGLMKYYILIYMHMHVVMYVYIDIYIMVCMYMCVECIDPGFEHLKCLNGLPGSMLRVVPAVAPPCPPPLPDTLEQNIRVFFI